MVILFWGIACFGFSLGSLETRFEGFDWSARWNLNSAHSRVFNFCENSKISTFYLFFQSFFGSKIWARKWSVLNKIDGHNSHHMVIRSKSGRSWC